MGTKKGAGQYSRQLHWWPRSYSKDTTGASNPQYVTYNGILWGSIQEGTPTGSVGEYSESFGADRSKTYVTIVLRQFPTVSPEDILIDVLFGQTYIIVATGTQWTANETLIIAYRLLGNPNGPCNTSFNILGTSTLAA